MGESWFPAETGPKLIETVLILLLWVAPAWGRPLEGTGPDAHRYDVTEWSILSGLPQRTVNGVTLDDDGSLWLGTFGGLANFDGLSFQVVDATTHPELPSVRVMAVAFADGAVWAALAHGGVARVEGDRLTSFPGLPEDIVWEVVSFRGVPFVAAGGSLWRLRGGRWERVMTTGKVRYLATTHDTLVAAGDEGVYRIDLEGETWIETPGFQSLAVAIDPVSDVTYLASVDRLGVLYGRHWSVLGERERGRPELAVDPTGTLWESRDAVLRHTTSPGSPSETATTWNLGSPVRELFVGPGGGLWVGTDHNGLMRMLARRFEVFGVNQGMPGQGVRSVALWQGQIVAASGCGSLVRLEDGRFEPIEFGELTIECPLALEPVGETLWFSHGAKVVELGPEGPRWEWRFPDVVAALHHDDQGVWVGTTATAYRILPDGTIVEAAVPPLGGVRQFERDPEGGLWLAQGGGVSRLHNGTWAIYEHRDGIPSGEVRALEFDTDGRLWVGTYGGGLARILGDDVVTITPQLGLIDSTVSAIVQSGDALWINGNRGVSHVSLAELNDAADGIIERARFQLYNTGEGNGGGQPGAVVGPSGRLWFPTMEGLVVVQPDFAVPTTPPVVNLTRVAVGGVSQPLEESIVVHTGLRTLDVEFGGTILSYPQLARFEYRLRPQQPRWIPAGDTRTVRYEHLAPGSYHFQVRVAPAAGWFSAPASIEIELPPRPWEVRWVLALAFAGISLITLVAVRTYLSRVRDHAARLQQEVVQRRTAEEALSISERHYRGLFEAVSDALILTAPGGEVLDASPSAKATLGQDLIGRSIRSVLSQEGEHTVVTRQDGTTLPVRVGRATLPNGRQLWSLSDVTELLDLQERVSHAYRLEAVGRLAGGVAHDFNNLLTALRADASLLATLVDQTEDTALARECVQGILSSVDRGASLTRQLLAYGRRQLLRPQVVDPAELLMGLEPALARLTRDDVRIQLPSLLTNGHVRVDAAQLELAVINLVINAGNAMPDGGEIRLWVGADDDWVHIFVADTGTGIDPEVLPRIFEPFFTTREGQGFGLGLASVHGFVTQSGGTIEAQSRPEGGAQFDIALPRLPDAQVVKPSDESTVEAPKGGTERIMLVDDEPALRRNLVRVLRAAGYTVIAAEDGHSALSKLTKRGVDLLLTDVLMPGMNGVELAEAVRERTPGLPVVFMSGYTDDVIGPSTKLRGRFLAKPFAPADLLAAVRAVLDGE